MNDNLNNSVLLEGNGSSFNFKQLLKLFALNWYWFIVSTIICLLIAFLYLWFTPSTMVVTGNMQLIDRSKQGSGMSAGLSMLNSLPFGIGSSFGGGTASGIDFEKEILKSNTLVREVVKKLNLHTEYRLCKWGKKSLLYPNNPLTVTLDEAHLQWFDTELPLTNHEIDLTITKDNNVYKVEITEIENKKETNLPVQTLTSIPATIKTNVGTLTIAENTLPEKQAKAFDKDYTLKVTIIPPITAANNFRKKWVDDEKKQVGPLNIVNISIRDESLLRSIDFINQLVSDYNLRANDEKNEEARKTDEFVNERLSKIDLELGSSDAAWENSKKSFQITSPELDANEATSKKSLYETQLVEIGTQLQLHDYLSDFVNDPDNLFEYVPLSLGASEGKEGAVASQNASLITQHNNMVNQRKELLKSMSEMSPQVQRLTQSIRELQPNIKVAMKRDRETILMNRQSIEREYSKYLGRVSKAPQMERVLTEIGRQREIKQGVFLVLLQKREETAMQLANTTDKGKLIDPPSAVSGSSKPKTYIAFFVALFFAAILPMGILYLIQILKTKIDTRSDLEDFSIYPVTSEIPLQDNGDAIRNLRTNLLLNMKEGQKTLLIASNAEGDGKSYIAQKLTDSLNAIDKKVFLIDGDLRKSNKGGHPADILASDSFAKEVAKAKAEYDYVIFDSPAMSMYADAYQLATFADATLFVVRSGSTDRSVIESLNGDGNLPNIMLVLNAIDTTTKKYKLNKK